MVPGINTNRKVLYLLPSSGRNKIKSTFYRYKNVLYCSLLPTIFFRHSKRSIMINYLKRKKNFDVYNFYISQILNSYLNTNYYIRVSGKVIEKKWKTYYLFSYLPFLKKKKIYIYQSKNVTPNQNTTCFRILFTYLLIEN